MTTMMKKKRSRKISIQNMTKWLFQKKSFKRGLLSKRRSRRMKFNHLRILAIWDWLNILESKRSSNPPIQGGNSWLWMMRYTLSRWMISKLLYITSRTVRLKAHISKKMKIFQRLLSVQTNNFLLLLIRISW